MEYKTDKLFFSFMSVHQKMFKFFFSAFVDSVALIPSLDVMHLPTRPVQYVVTDI